MAEGDGGVSLVHPDGTSTPVVPDTPGQTAPRVGETQPAPATTAKQTEADREAATDAKLSAIWDKHNPPETTDKPVVSRAKDGKFASKKEPEYKLADEEAKPEIEATETKEEEPAKEASPAIPIPKSWSSEGQSIWPKLSPDEQKYLSERETQAHTTISQQGRVIAAFKPVGELVQRYKPMFEYHQVAPIEAIGRLLDVQRKLDQAPVETIQAIAKIYKVDLAKEFGGQVQASQGEPTGEAIQVPPEVVAQIVEPLQNELFGLKNRLTQRENQERQATVVAEQRAQEATNQDVDQWSTGKPYFNDVRSTMSVLIASGEADSLDDAYDMACYANPKVRTKLSADQAKAAQTAEAQETARHASAAKRASVAQVGSSSRRTAPASGNGKWDDDGNLEALYDRIAAGS